MLFIYNCSIKCGNAFQSVSKFLDSLFPRPNRNTKTVGIKSGRHSSKLKSQRCFSVLLTIAMFASLQRQLYTDTSKSNIKISDGSVVNVPKHLLNVQDVTSMS